MGSCVYKSYVSPKYTLLRIEYDPNKQIELISGEPEFLKSLALTMVNINLNDALIGQEIFESLSTNEGYSFKKVFRLKETVKNPSSAFKLALKDVEDCCDEFVRIKKHIVQRLHTMLDLLPKSGFEVIRSLNGGIAITTMEEVLEDLQCYAKLGEKMGLKFDFSNSRIFRVGIGKKVSELIPKDFINALQNLKAALISDKFALSAVDGSVDADFDCAIAQCNHAIERMADLEVRKEFL